MSTNIAILRGSSEVIDEESKLTRIPKYKPEELYLTRFMGGNVRGISLQLTIGDRYIQLDTKTADKLSAILNNWKNAPEI